MPSSSSAATPATGGVLLPDLQRTCAEALEAADAFAGKARQSVAALVEKNGRADAGLLEREQFAAHGFAWLTTYVSALRQLAGWADRLAEEGQLGELESLILQAGFGEYLQQMRGGILLSQGEIVRPADMGIPDEAVRDLATGPVELLVLDCAHAPHLESPEATTEAVLAHLAPLP